MKRIVFFISLFSFFILPHVVSAAVSFRRPLNTVLNPPISANYDNNGSAPGVRDYKCGTNTYNNHQGTDFIATIDTPIYNAARGGLYYRYNNCPTKGFYGSDCGGGFGNHVRMDHDGPGYFDGIGTQTIYAHMKRGTPIWWRAGISECGAHLGLVGSSGSSTGPHLHFEVRRNGHPLDDPYSGQCNARGSASGTYWNMQYDPMYGPNVPAAWCGF